MRQQLLAVGANGRGDVCWVNAELDADSFFEYDDDSVGTLSPVRVCT